MYLNVSPMCVLLFCYYYVGPITLYVSVYLLYHQTPALLGFFTITTPHHTLVMDCQTFEKLNTPMRWRYGSPTSEKYFQHGRMFSFGAYLIASFFFPNSFFFFHIGFFFFWKSIIRNIKCMLCMNQSETGKIQTVLQMLSVTQEDKYWKCRNESLNVPWFFLSMLPFYRL